MTLTDEEIMAQRALDQIWEGLDLIAQDCCCAVCEGLLVVRWNSKASIPELVCGTDNTHEGYIKEKSYTQLYKAGYAIPLEVINNLQRKGVI